MTSLTRLLLLPILLDPTITWRERADLPEPRAGYIAGTLEGKLVIAGGSYWENDRKIYSARADAFDLTSNRWTPLPKLPEPRSDAASVTFRNAIYAFGGVVDGKLSDSVARLDASGWSTSMKLPQPLMYSVASATNEGIFLFGGLTTMGDLSTASRSLLFWQPGGEWKRLTDFPGLPRVTAAVTTAGGKVYVFGGVHMPKPGAPIQNLDDVWSYDSTTNSWAREITLPVARRAWSAVPAGDQILLLGGYTDDFSSDVYSFEPKSRRVTMVGALPHALADAKYVQIGNTLITAGGESGIKVRSRWTLQGELKGSRK